MNVMRGGPSIDILVMGIRASEIIAGTGETVPVMSRTPHDEGAGKSYSMRRRGSTRHSGEGGCWWW